MYGLADPLQCFKNDVPKKSEYKEAVYTKITAFYEKNLTEKNENKFMQDIFKCFCLWAEGKKTPCPLQYDDHP